MSGLQPHPAHLRRPPRRPARGVRLPPADEPVHRRLRPGRHRLHPQSEPVAYDPVVRTFAADVEVHPGRPAAGRRGPARCGAHPGGNAEGGRLSHPDGLGPDLRGLRVGCLRGVRRGGRGLRRTGECRRHATPRGADDRPPRRRAVLPLGPLPAPARALRSHRGSVPHLLRRQRGRAHLLRPPARVAALRASPGSAREVPQRSRRRADDEGDADGTNPDGHPGDPPTASRHVRRNDPHDRRRSRRPARAAPRGGAARRERRGDGGGPRRREWESATCSTTTSSPTGSSTHRSSCACRGHRAERRGREGDERGHPSHGDATARASGSADGHPRTRPVRAAWRRRLPVCGGWAPDSRPRAFQTHRLRTR